MEKIFANSVLNLFVGVSFRFFQNLLIQKFEFFSDIIGDMGKLFQSFQIWMITSLIIFIKRSILDFVVINLDLFKYFFIYFYS